MDILQNDKPGAALQSRLKGGNWKETLLLVYIFLLPYTSAFAFTSTISLPLIFAVGLFFTMAFEMIRSVKLPQGFVGFDLMYVFLLLFLVIFSFVINGWGIGKSLNHTIAYLSTFLLFYVAVKFALFSLNNTSLALKRILQAITYATCISAIFASVEFISANVFKLDLNQFIPRAVEGEDLYNPTVIGLFIRARGFATESGHFTLMMELFSPLTIYYLYFSGYCKWAVLPRLILVIIIVFSFIFAASSASFVILPLALALAAVAHIKRIFLYLQRHPKKVTITTLVASAIFIVFNYFLSLYAMILLSLTDKLDSNSFDDRQERIDFFYDKFFHFDPIVQLCGAGPAGFINLGYDESKSSLSLYYKLAFETGYLGLLLFTLFIFYLLINTIQIKSKVGFFLLISVICGIIHYYFISNYWYPWFWFIAAFAIFCNKKNIRA